MNTELTSSNRISISIIGIVIVFIVLKALGIIFIPLVIAIFLFFAFTPMNNYFEKKKISPNLIILIDVFIILIIFAFLSTIIVDSFTRLGSQLPGFLEKLNQIMLSLAVSWGLERASEFNISNIIEIMNIEVIAQNVFTSTFSVMGTLTFVLFFFIFVLTGYKKIFLVLRRRYFINDLNTDETRQFIIKETIEEITGQIQKYIFTRFMISISRGLTTVLLLWVFGVDFFIVWGVLSFLLNFIPKLGSVIAVILPTLMALVQFDSTGYAFTILVVLSFINIILGYFIEPQIFGGDSGLNPLVIILSLLLWAYIWGITGILLSIPITVSIKIIISRAESPMLQFINDVMSG